MFEGNNSNQAYVVDGENYIRVKYHLKGSQREATVHADLKQATRDKYLLLDSS